MENYHGTIWTRKEYGEWTHMGKKWSSIYKAFPSTKRESKYIKWKSQSVFAHWTEKIGKECTSPQVSVRNRPLLQVFIIMGHELKCHTSIFRKFLLCLVIENSQPPFVGLSTDRICTRSCCIQIRSDIQYI